MDRVQHTVASHRITHNTYNMPRASFFKRSSHQINKNVKVHIHRQLKDMKET